MLWQHYCNLNIIVTLNSSTISVIIITIIYYSSCKTHILKSNIRLIRHGLKQLTYCQSVFLQTLSTAKSHHTEIMQ